MGAHIGTGISIYTNKDKGSDCKIIIDDSN